MISKQESMVHLAGLDLHLCSETIEIVSISGCYHLTEDGGHVSKSNSRLNVTLGPVFLSKLSDLMFISE
jgi:hypothetical protein